jgi:Glycosyltransferase family 87
VRTKNPAGRPTSATKSASPFEIGAGVAFTAIMMLLVVLAVANSGLLRKADFAVPYTGGLILRQGTGARLYDLHLQEQVQERLLNRPGLLFDPYPPFHALLFAPLTLLGYRAAYILWGVVNVLLWVLFCRLLGKDVGRKIQPFRFLALAGLFFPIWITLMQGQFSLLLVVSLTLAFLWLKRDRDFAAGIALGLGLLKFQVIVPFALIFLLRRKWKFISGLLTMAALLALVSLITAGPAGIGPYITLLLDSMRHPANPAFSTVKPWNMATLRGLVEGLWRDRISQSWVSALSGMLSTALIAMMAWFWNREDRCEDRGHFDLMFAASVTASLLATPYLYAHDLSPLCLAIILVVASPAWNVASTYRTIIAWVMGLLYASPLYLPTLVKSERQYMLAPVLIVFALAVLALAVRQAGPSARGVLEDKSVHEPRARETVAVTN